MILGIGLPQKVQTVEIDDGVHDDGAENAAAFGIAPGKPDTCGQVLQKGQHQVKGGVDSDIAHDMHGGKGRMDLLPWAAIIEVSKHCEAGALKYGVHNVDKGIPTSSLMDSAMRHAAKYLDGQEDEDHLLAAAWNILWAIEMRCKKPECVDTPWKEEKE